jgi:hypothetical protein
LHRANKLAQSECGWKGGDSGGDSAGEKPCPTKKQKNPLDSDRPSHGRLGGLLIMMGQHDRSEALFYYFRLEDQVPETHLLRLIDRHISFEFVREPS